MLEPVRVSWQEEEPIQWNRVHNLAAFVYFNHSAHINNGIGCESCWKLRVGSGTTVPNTYGTLS